TQIGDLPSELVVQRHGPAGPQKGKPESIHMDAGADENPRIFVHASFPSGRPRCFHPNPQSQAGANSPAQPSPRPPWAFSPKRQPGSETSLVYASETRVAIRPRLELVAPRACDTVFATTCGSSCSAPVRPAPYSRNCWSDKDMRSGAATETWSARIAFSVNAAPYRSPKSTRGICSA